MTPRPYRRAPRTRRRITDRARRRGRSFLVLLVISVHVGCSGASSSDPDDGVPPQAGLFKDNTLVVHGVARTYDYYVPTGSDSSAKPLVILFHGGGSSPEDLTGESGTKAPYKVWMEVAEAEKFIVVYPEGTENPLSGLGWNDCRADATTNPAVDDVGFVAALIDDLSASFNIDASRVYASGTSNGGHMSLRLALQLSDRVAAVAPVAAAMPAVPCHGPERPVSVLFMNGTADPLLPYGGGPVAPDVGGRGTVLSAQASVALWVDFLKTDANPAEVRFPDLDSGDDSTARSLTYSNGIEGTQVVLYEIAGGGHLEPSIQEQYSGVVELLLGRQNHDIEMARRIWDFFRDKTL